MPFTVTMPKLSPTMESGVIAKWHKKEGEHVAAGDLLLEVSTDKATVEHNALDEGWLRKILLEEGKEAAINQPIAIFTEEKDESIEGYQPEGETVVEEKPPQVSVQETVTSKRQETTFKEERIFASPLAKKIAKEKGFDLSAVEGSGPRKRIVARDLEKIGVPTEKRVKEPSGTFEEVPLSQMRKVIAARLQEAKTTIPHFYVEKSIHVDQLVNFREQLSHVGHKVSFNDCVVKATALALREHPIVNCGFNPKSNTVLQYKTIDISVAVNLPTGLITPIVTHTDHKSLTEISSEIKALVVKAKEGKLHPKEFQGGSFTVSNLGMFGVKNFQAIINPPQVAILSVGGIMDLPIVKEGMVVPGKMMNVTLSCDHRVVDGVAAAEFLQTLQKFLENPIALLI